MIAELVRQYDTLKRCGVAIPDPGFAVLPVSLEITLLNDGSARVDWIEVPDTTRKKSKKTIPIPDMECPVSERSASRSSSNDTPHALVDNPTWVFGELDERNGKARRVAYLSQVRAFIRSSPQLGQVKSIYSALVRKSRRQKIWEETEKVLRSGVKEKDGARWLRSASKKNIRWVIDEVGTKGRPAHAFPQVKDAWVAFLKKQSSWKVISCLGGEEQPARNIHPQPRSASLISFNDPVFYPSHLHPDYRRDALGAQIGFEEAEKYSLALEWLLDRSSVRFGDTTHCIWVDQSQESGTTLGSGAHDLTKSQAERTAFSRGKAKGEKGVVLAETGDLIQSLQQFRNGPRGAGYRDKRFILLSLLLRRKGRHAILGGFRGTMGELEDNTDGFIRRTEINIPRGFAFKDADPRPFCPTLMDILDAAGTKSEKKRQLTWDREVMNVIVLGQALPTDLLRAAVIKAVQQKHLECGNESRTAYCRLLATAVACSRHALNTLPGKEVYGMDMDTGKAAPGYLAGRFFAVCEDIQKQGRGWKATLSDKLFGAAINRPREILAQLYQNCRCYEISRGEDEAFKEILGKVSLSDTSLKGTAQMPENGVDAFEFILGYWHQRARIQEDRETHKKLGKEGGNTHD